jgi:cytochrome b subunit of formate dehydrogenase
MSSKVYIKRYNRIQQLFHLGILITFLIQAATGLSRLFITTDFGRFLSGLLGGYDMATVIHFWGGIAMVTVFTVHVIYLLTKVNWRKWENSIFGPDSIVPNLEDARHLLERVLWFFGLASAPRLDRWAYWEKFGYWGVFWGVPLLGLTGIMLRFPLLTTKILPGWTLNVAALLHRAEAILAIAFIFIVHFFFGHLSPSKFPMNEAMFSGCVPLDEVEEEKPAWLERLEREGKMEFATVKPPALWYRILYFVFGFSAFSFGIYLLANAIIYGRYIQLH